MPQTTRQGKPPIKGRYDWPTIIRRLRRNPEEWNEIATQVPRTLYGAIKRRRITALRDPEWVYEVCTRNTNGSLADIWMMARPRTEEEKDTWDSRL